MVRSILKGTFKSMILTISWLRLAFSLSRKQNTNANNWIFLTCSAPGGDFQSVLDEDMVPFEEDVQGFLRQILEALDFIHERNIAHLDIKVMFYKWPCH